MLRFGKMTDYAFAILDTLARNPQQALSAHAVAALAGLPEPTVSKILKTLARGGAIFSVRGAGGGYHLKKKSKEISVLEIVEIMEGRVTLVECVEVKHTCTIDKCPVQGRWGGMNAILRDTLSSWSLQDLGADKILQKSSM